MHKEQLPNTLVLGDTPDSIFVILVRTPGIPLFPQRSRKLMV